MKFSDEQIRDVLELKEDLSEKIIKYKEQIEKLEKNPSKYLPTISKSILSENSVAIDLNQPMEKICSILDKKVAKDTSYSQLISFVEDRAGHDRRYAIDATKLEEKLGWKADENFESGIVKTIKWYLKKYM